jgi:transposase
MPAERVPMRCVREILRLKHGCGATDRMIARSTGLARSTVSGYLDRATAAGLGWPLPPMLTDAALEALLFARAGIAPGTRRKAEPDWPAIHRELRRRGVTLMLLWQEYRAQNPKAFGYSRFCELYRDWESRLSPTMRQVHPAGEQLFVDYAGQTVDVIDGATGEVRAAQIFVAVLGASSYTYAEATATQTLPDWIGAHVRALSFIGGVPRQIVPDYVPGNIIRFLCPRRLCGGPPRIPAAVTATGHISIREQRAIRGALARSAKLVFGEVPPRRSKEVGTLRVLPASS